MVGINHLIRINAKANEVFQSITSNEKISEWFTDTHCLFWEVGANVIWFGNTEMTITKFMPNQSLSLHVNNGGGWENTDITFAIEADGDQTILRFDHLGWKSITDHFRACSMSWAYFLESLKKYLETGVGTPEHVSPKCTSDERLKE